MEEHDQADRVLPQQDRLADQAGPGAGRALRRQGARQAGRPGHAARHRAQDGQRHPRQRVRRPGHHRRHPLPAAGAPVGVDRRDRPGQDRARRRRAVREARLDHAVAPGDLPRPPGLPRPQAGLRGLHARADCARPTAPGRPTRRAPRSCSRARGRASWPPPPASTRPSCRRRRWPRTCREVERRPAADAGPCAAASGWSVLAGGLRRAVVAAVVPTSRRPARRLRGRPAGHRHRRRRSPSAAGESPLADCAALAAPPPTAPAAPEAAAGADLPATTLACFTGGAAVADRQPARAGRGQPLGLLVPAVPRGTARVPAARRARRPAACTSSASTRWTTARRPSASPTGSG